MTRNADYVRRCGCPPGWDNDDHHATACPLWQHENDLVAALREEAAACLPGSMIHDLLTEAADALAAHIDGSGSDTR